MLIPFKCFVLNVYKLLGIPIVDINNAMQLLISIGVIGIHGINNCNVDIKNVNYLYQQLLYQYQQFVLLISTSCALLISTIAIIGITPPLISRRH